MQYDRESSERPPLPMAGYMENYTNAFLVTAGALTFMSLVAIWAIFGLPFAVTLAFLIERFFLRT